MTGKVRLSPIDEIFLAKLPKLSVDFTTVYHCLPTALYFVNDITMQHWRGYDGAKRGRIQDFGRRVPSNRKLYNRTR